MPREVIANGEFSTGSDVYTMAMLFYEFYMALSGTDRLQCVPFCNKHRTRVWASLANTINQSVFLASRTKSLIEPFNHLSLVHLALYFAIKQMTFATDATEVLSRSSISFTFFIFCFISRYWVIYWKDVFLIAPLDALNGYTRI